MKAFLSFQNPWIELLARWCLGCVFVYASIHKIVNPAEFARIIYGYGLFPGSLINLMAIIIPFVELTCGVALLVGIFPRSAALLVDLLLVGFIVAISINLIRGHQFDCGCFAFSHAGESDSAVFLLVRDVFWLAVSVPVFVYKKKPHLSLMVP